MRYLAMDKAPRDDKCQCKDAEPRRGTSIIQAEKAIREAMFHRKRYVEIEFRMLSQCRMGRESYTVAYRAIISFNIAPSARKYPPLSIEAGLAVICSCHLEGGSAVVFLFLCLRAYADAYSNNHAQAERGVDSGIRRDHDRYDSDKYRHER